MSACDKTLPGPIQPVFKASSAAESLGLQSLIQSLNLQKHVEGGYFVETDRDALRIANPFVPAGSTTDPKEATRNASTTIYYLLTPTTPTGYFHRNRCRIIHSVHRGRGRYVIIHPSTTAGEPARIETFIVGQNTAAGERLQWIVEGGPYKASFLLPDEEGGADSEGLLITETAVPGFEFSDHNFLPVEELPKLVTPEQSKELGWLLRQNN